MPPLRGPALAPPHPHPRPRRRANMPSRAPRGAVDVSADQFGALFEELCTWKRWGSDDERGALNLLTAERVAAAAGLVRDGITTTLSLPLNTHGGEHNPNPADHYMTALAAVAADADRTHFNKDYVGADYHNDGHTHIDALSHVA